MRDRPSEPSLLNQADQQERKGLPIEVPVRGFSMSFGLAPPGTCGSPKPGGIEIQVRIACGVEAYTNRVSIPPNASPEEIERLLKTLFERLAYPLTPYVIMMRGPLSGDGGANAPQA